jgi:hypothetical protein
LKYAGTVITASVTSFPVPNLDARRVVLAADDLVRDLFNFVLDLVVEAAHEPLDRGHGVLGIRDGLALRRGAHEALAVVFVGHDGRRGARSFRVFDDFGVVPLHHRHDRVRRAKVDSNDFTHEYVCVGSDQFESRRRVGVEGQPPFGVPNSTSP